MYSEDEQDDYSKHTEFHRLEPLNKSKKERAKRQPSQHEKSGYKIEWSCDIPLLRCFQSSSDDVEYRSEAFIKNLFGYQTYYILIFIFLGISPSIVLMMTRAMTCHWVVLNGAILLMFCNYILIPKMPPESEPREEVLELLLCAGLLVSFVAISMFLPIVIYCVFLLLCMLLDALYTTTNENGRIFLNGGAKRLRTSPMGILLETVGAITFIDEE